MAWKNVQYENGKMRTSEGGGGSSSTFAGLDDVSFSNLQNGQVPKYNSTTQKWENANESGGGGTVTDVEVDGVSVVNQQGVAEIIMPTPPTIPVTDVKVNGTSVVDADKEAQIKSYKEVTQAEYNALPDSKLNDGILYAIKDVGGSDGFPPLIYSDEEREVGVWRDGKPLYQKTLYYNEHLYGNVNKDVTALNIDTCVDISGMTGEHSQWGYCATFGYARESSSANITALYNGQNKQLQLRFGSDYSDSNYFNGCNITLLYTKTTDTAGSGTWTTQGALAHHYSTDEHIIGTWIDGKPLYEITVDCGYLLNNATKKVSTGILNIDTIANYSMWGKRYSLDIHTTMPIPFLSSSSTYNIDVYIDVQDSDNMCYIVVTTHSDRTNLNAFAILQYTKTTD